MHDLRVFFLFSVVISPNLVACLLFFERDFDLSGGLVSTKADSILMSVPGQGAEKRNWSLLRRIGAGFSDHHREDAEAEADANGLPASGAGKHPASSRQLAMFGCPPDLRQPIGLSVGEIV